MNINQQQLQVLNIFNQTVPDEGPKTVPLFLDFAANADYTLDMSLFQERDFMQLVQTIYVDCSKSASDITITIGQSNQIIIAKAGSQGYYPVLVPNFTRIDFASAGGVMIPVYLINVPISGLVWPNGSGECPCPPAIEFVQKNGGASLPQEPIINFIEGSNITLTIADNPGSTRTDVTIASSGGGGGTPGGSPTQKQYNNAGSFGGLIGTSIIPQLASWPTVVNNGHMVVDDFSTDFMSLHCPSVSGVAVSGIFQNLGSPTSYTIIARIHVVPENNGGTGAMEGQLVLTDGTKFITFECLNEPSSSQNPLIEITTWSNGTTQVTQIAGPTIQLIGNVVTLKIVGDATNRTYFYWASGAWVQFFQEPIGTFLTETQGGVGILNLNSISTGASVTVTLHYWSNTTP